MFILKKLLKNELFSLLNMNNMFDTRKGKAKNPVLLATGGALFVAFLMGLSGFYSFFLASGLVVLNAMNLLPLAMFVAGSIAVFFFAAMHSSSTLFASKDYDLLLSLPIPSRTIILSKLIYLYISNLGFALIFMLPCLGIWWYFVRPEALLVVLALGCLPFIPIIPIVLATIVGTLVAFLAGRSRNKTLVSIVSNLVFIFGIIYISQVATAKAAQGVNIAFYAIAMKDQLLRQYPPSRLFFDATQGNIASFVCFVAVSVAVAVIFVLLTAAIFKPVHSKLSGVSMKASKARLTYNSNGTFKALFKKEAKRFFASSVYVINSGVGAIMCLCAVGYLVFFGREYVNTILETPALYNMVVPFMPLLAASFASLTCPSASSVSMEGQSLWATKQLPVSAYSIFMAKISWNLCMTIPVTMVASVAGIFLLKLTGLSVAMVIIFPLSICFAVSYMGLMLNLAFPSFNWTSEVKVVKQSAPMAIATFGAIGVIGITFILIGMIFNRENANIVYMIISTILIVSVFFTDKHLRENSESILLKL